MKRLRPLLLLLVLGGLGYAAYYYYGRPPTELTLTGIVTTNDVVVSPQISGQIAELKVAEGDVVKKDQLVAVIRPDELQADAAYYQHSLAGLGSQVQESEAALRFQERQTSDQIKQAESNLASAEAQQMAATADLENAKLVFDRTRNLAQKGVDAPQALDQARTANDAAEARLDSLKKQVEAQRSALALARAQAEQISVRRSQVQATQAQQQAANAQRTKAEVRLSYTEVHAPIDGIVDVRAIRVGEIVTPGQPIVTLINPDDLWIRADVEETYIDRIRLGDRMQVRLPSGETREATVFYRGVDAGFATQRDVSRTKRDIKTFEIRLRADNRDRRLAVGMTAYVLLPLK
ncbi:MAG TPA: HlyD family efflux transporter periplasmic adaptor subunit [Vicinamibacterales bacterium]|nr:HlyD family efflux transporter periplasmic adaptor subunit [Vicinamibacterales bacterium]